MFMAIANSLVVLFYCCATADILTKLLQQFFFVFHCCGYTLAINKQVSVYRTIGPTLVVKFYDDFSNNDRKNPLLSYYFFIFFGTKKMEQTRNML